MGKKRAVNDEPILVALDFSESSEAALVWAAEAAKSFGRRLVLLHVVHDPHSSPGYYMQSQKKKVRKRALEARHAVERLEDAAKKLFHDFIRAVSERHPELKGMRDHERTTVVGLPATRILEVIEREGASLVVMGSQGRTGIARVMLGSKAERVARLAPVPVVIVKVPPRSPDKAAEADKADQADKADKAFTAFKAAKAEKAERSDKADKADT